MESAMPAVPGDPSSAHNVASCPPPTPNPDTSPSPSPSLISKVRRRISSRTPSVSVPGLRQVKDHLPNSLRSRSFSGNSVLAAPEDEAKGITTGVLVDEPRAYTIAPPDHRENTALHALFDSLPSLPSLHAPSIPFVPKSARSPVPSCVSADVYDSDSPPPSPSLTRSNSTFGNHKGANSADPLERLFGDVVVLGGYRGSVLRDAKTNKRLWIPLKVGFGIRKADLRLGLEDEDELRSTETVIPGHMLMQIGGVIDLGKRLKDKLKSVAASSAATPSSPFPFTSPSYAPPADPERPPLRFHSFGYDWRRSLHLSSAELLVFLQRLKEESAKRGEGKDGKGLGATVLAHSMGGLVTLHALALAPDPTVFRGIVFAGTPFQGCVNILGPLGQDQGLKRNPDVGSPRVVFSWRSSFYFLPRPPYHSSLDLSTETENDDDTPFPSSPADPSTPTLTASPKSSDIATFAEPSAKPLNLLPALAPSPPVTAPRPTTTSSTPPLARSSFQFPFPRSPGLPAPSTTPDPRPPLTAILNGCFETPSGTPLPVDFFDPREWARCHLSPVVVGLYDAEKGVEAGAGERCRENVSKEGEGAEDATGKFSMTSGPGNLGEQRLPGAGVVEQVLSGGQDLAEEVVQGHPQEEAGGAEDAGGEPEIEEDEVVRRYLERTLSRAKEFHAELLERYTPSLASSYPPIALVSSRRTPTVRGVLATSHAAIPQEGYEKLLWDEGDGIVLWESATRLPGAKAVRKGDDARGGGGAKADGWSRHVTGVVESSNGHLGLLGDLDAVRRALECIYPPS
ncbi:hypothetical protein JCM21900_005505 [Sporobolomyces salmonicolor]